MPCNGGNYFGGRDRIVSDPKDAKTIDDLTRKLCYALELLDSSLEFQPPGPTLNIPAELDEWWYEHKLADQERTKEARRRANAQSAKARRTTYLASVRKRVLTQLSPDELEALGVK